MRTDNGTWAGQKCMGAWQFDHWQHGRLELRALKAGAGGLLMAPGVGGEVEGPRQTSNTAARVGRLALGCVGIMRLLGG
jgi:hypothetical protein